MHDNTRTPITVKLVDKIEISEPPVGIRRDYQPPLRKQQPPSKPPNKQYTPNDAGRAERFVDRFQNDIRFVPERQIWLTWDAGRWRIDRDGALERLAIKMSRDLLGDAGQIPGVDDAAAKKRAVACADALAFGERRNISDFLALAKVDQRILLPVSQLDSDPWIVGAKNAVIELKTGTVREYSRNDYITRTLGCEVDPQATCPRWKKFMEEVFPDSDLRHYVHKALGYTLTGNTEEECFFFCHGTGRNGKSKTITTAEHVFGGLWARAGKGIIAASSWRDYPIRELADIVGADLSSLRRLKKASSSTKTSSKT
jgi:putative DNA primase/helicase